MAQLFDQYYVNSPNFPPLIREKKDVVRNIDQSLLPSKKKQVQKFKFVYTKPSDVYEEIVKDSRSSLVSNKVLMKHTNVFYNDKLNTNLTAVYDFDVKLFEDLEQNDNFHLYEKYIYLISMII